MLNLSRYETSSESPPPPCAHGCHGNHLHPFIYLQKDDADIPEILNQNGNGGYTLADQGKDRQLQTIRNCTITMGVGQKRRALRYALLQRLD